MTSPVKNALVDVIADAAEKAAEVQGFDLVSRRVLREVVKEGAKRVLTADTARELRKTVVMKHREYDKLTTDEKLERHYDFSRNFC